MTSKKESAPSIQLAKTRLINLVLILISLGWLMTVVPDYLFHHPYYAQGISQFKYWGLLLVLSILLGGMYFIFSGGLQRQKIKSKAATISGWKIYLLLLLLMNVILAWYGISNNIFNSNPIVHLSYFSGFLILLHTAVLYITILGYAIGHILLRPFVDYLSSASFKLIAVALGLSAMGFLLVLLGLLNGLRSWILWPLAILVTTLRYHSIGHFLKDLFLTPVSTSKLKVQGFLAVAILMIFMAVNSIGSIKAFPAGFDGTALYMNITKLISEYNALPEGGQAFNWSIIMSLGNLLFGSTLVSILLSHLAGIFCLVAVYRIARLFVTRSNALLATALFYTAPFITFHNYYDEKVDLGFLFISLSTLLLLMEYFFKNGKKEVPDKKPFTIKIGRLKWTPDLLIWIYAGWLTGFAFGIKYTALFNGIAFLAYLFYKKGGRYAFLGSLMMALSFVFLLSVYRFAGFELSGTSPLLLGGLLFVLGITLLGWAFRHSHFTLLRTTGIALAFGLSTTFAFSPWIVKHFSENGTLQVSALIQGKSPQPQIFVKREYQQNQLQAEKQAAHSAAIQTRREELQRYIGFETGLPLYLSLPYDLTMNTNLPGLIYLDIGFLWLLLLPLLLLSAKPRNIGKNLLLLLLIFSVWLVSLLSVYVAKVRPTLPQGLVDLQPEGLRHSIGGIYEFWMELLIHQAKNLHDIYDWLSQLDFISSLAVLLLLLGTAFWLASEKLRSMPVVLKSLLAFVVAYLFLWLLLGSGIPWYAFPALAILPILVVYYFERPEQFLGTTNTHFSYYFIGFNLGLYLLLNLSLHFSDPDRGDNRHLIFKKPYIQYATRSMDWEEALAAFNPFYKEALEYLNNDPSEKIYRVGTYMQYHIIQNDRRVLEDNQLGKFDGLISNLSDQNYFFQVLRDNGFRYILYDLNSASLDKTPEQSLREKNIAFLNLLLDPNEVKLVVTDRIIEDPEGGIVHLPDGALSGKPGLSGKVTYAGSFALFEIR